MTTLYLSHPAALAHQTPPGHPERADRIRAIERVLEQERFATLVREPAPIAEEEAILRAHPAHYLTTIRDAAPREGFLRVDADTVTQQLKQAYGRLRGIEAAAHGIAVPEFRERLSRITGIGRTILAEIERDPREAPRARRFLNLYLDGAERITLDYARTHSQLRNQPLEQNFRNLLVDMEGTFAEQHKKLVERDLLSLDVDIEVLNARLKRDGLG